MEDNFTPAQRAEIRQIIREELDSFANNISKMAAHEANHAKMRDERMTQNSMLAITIIFRQWIVDYLQARQFAMKIANDTMDHVINDKLKNHGNEEAN